MLAGLRHAGRLGVPGVSFALLAACGCARAADAAAPEASAQSPHAYAIHIAHGAAAGTVRRVLDGARRRLSEPRCQRVLDDFRDGSGRRLRDRLEGTSRSPEDYLELIVFYDGRGQAMTLSMHSAKATGRVAAPRSRKPQAAATRGGGPQPILGLRTR